MPRSLFPFFLLSNALPCSVKSASDATHRQPPCFISLLACLMDYTLPEYYKVQNIFFPNWGNFFSQLEK